MVLESKYSFRFVGFLLDPQMMYLKKKSNHQLCIKMSGYWDYSLSKLKEVNDESTNDECQIDNSS